VTRGPKKSIITDIAGILMVFTILITLSRANFISTPGTILIIIILNSYIFRKSKVFALTKILIPLAISLLIINFTLPKYVDYIVNISEDTFLLLTNKIHGRKRMPGYPGQMI
jgi:O-antigen ligase